jgi:hypothetical protein
MQLTGVVRMSALISLLSVTAFVYAQDQHEDTKPPQDEARPEATKPAPKDANPPRQQQDAKPPKQNDLKPSRDEDQAGQQDAKPSKETEHAAQSSQHAQQSGRIPDDKFRAHFGRQHTVVINQPTIVEGQPRFQSGGYWFSIVDAWPVGWAYTDQCYIDYIDGEYFLFDLLHPGVRIELFVVL